MLKMYLLTVYELTVNQAYQPFPNPPICVLRLDQQYTNIQLPIGIISSE